MTMNRPRGFPGRVIFDHLPKTAGQAINAWLVSALGSGCATTSLNAGHRELISRLGGEYSLISAHVTFNGEGLDPRYQYATFMREPIDRAISWLFFVQQNYNANDLPEIWHDVVEFIDSDGESSVDRLDQIVNPYTVHFGSIYPTQTSSDAERLSKALAALDEFDVWGVYDAMPEFLGDFAALLGVPAPDKIAKVNVTRERPSANRASARIRQRLADLNALDLEFYEIVKARYTQERKRWQRPAVLAAGWKPIERPVELSFSDPTFTLISAALEGQRACKAGSTLSFVVEFAVSAHVSELEIGIHIFDSAKRWAFGTNTTMLERKVVSVAPGTYQVRYVCVADLPDGDYTAGFAFTEKLAAGERRLAWYDVLVDFSVSRERVIPSIGYAELSTAMDCFALSIEPPGPIKDATGTLEALSAPHAAIAGATYEITVVLSNHSAQDWVSLHEHPINLSYRWQDEHGNITVLDGLRTALPQGRLARGHNVETKMTVQAPNSPGHYEFYALPVQEMVCWFDNCGFTPLRFSTNVQTDAGRS
ncbi:hypothetical protein OKW49_002421 [Paraburkholderia youngii]|uniref:Wzt carbohydrate-binding domain-containing protein n=1 Tax=Paraburkholderia youngii TaxID=2782701 RepID=UPI003D1A0E82